MESVKGTRTEQNLLKAFAGESQASRRYKMFAKKAQEEGYEQIAAIFNETALNEDEHARIYFSFLEGGMVEITASYPAGVVGTTAENLAAAAGGEEEEWSAIYPEFARIAEEEGFKKIATHFKLIAAVEKTHMERYRKLQKRVEEEKVFEREEDIEWICRECGYHHKGKKAPKTCPNCLKTQAYFEEYNDNY